MAKQRLKKNGEPCKKPGPKKGTGGAPLTYTDKRVASVLADIAKGRSIIGACNKHGVAHSTFYVWLKRDDVGDLLDKFMRAQGDSEYKYQDVLDEALGDRNLNASAALEILSRLFRHWRKTNLQEISGKDGGPIKVLDYTKLTDAQLQAIAKGETPGDL